MSQSLSPSLKSHPIASQWIDFPTQTKVVLYSGKVELGQGISAALIQTLCCELGFSPDQVDLSAGDTGLTPDEGYTAGSQSVEVGIAAIRRVCAVVRNKYAEFASQHLNCKLEELSISQGKFISRFGNVTYKEISVSLPLNSIQVDDLQTPLFDSPMPAPIIVERLDLFNKFTTAGYIHDIEIKDMMHARILRGPHPDCKPLNLDIKALESLIGVDKVFVKNQFIALIGVDEERLIQALSKAKKMTQWTKPLAPVCKSIEELLTSQSSQSTVVVDEKGDTLAFPRSNSNPTSTLKSLRQRYSRPYIAHASIGLVCALAQPSSDKKSLTIWSHSQGVFKLKEQIVKSLNLDMDKVRIIHSPGAGCYGHNAADDVAFDAALIANSLGIAVRVVWSREDELTQSPMGSASLVELSAQITQDGKISNWNAQIWSNTHLSRPGWGDGIQLLGYWNGFGDELKPIAKDVPLPTGGGLRNAIPPYSTNELRIEHHFIKTSPVRVSALRSLGAHANVFAIESFMDELAEQIQMDPVQLRLINLKNERAKAVIKRVSEMAAWSMRGETGSSIGLGLGYSQYKNHAGHCAIVVQVELTHKVIVQKVWACVDAGQIVHRDGLINQIEGGIIQSLSWTLKECVDWDSNGITTSDWETYPILGFDEIPDIEIELIENTSDPSLGAGEVAAGPTAAALSNALSHAMGIKFRNMPYTTENVMKTIENSV